MKDNICYSGGAKGADLLFGECAEKAGHDVIHWTFGNRKGTHILTQNDLNFADNYLIKANETLKRTFPTEKEYINNLLRRNWFQIILSERIYAVTPLNENFIPYGGTAWAIVMGMNKGVKEIYVFDYAQDKWFFYNGYTWNEITLQDIPKPHGHYAGIGSRELPENGQQAIKDLYNDRHSTTVSGPDR